MENGWILCSLKFICQSQRGTITYGFQCHLEIEKLNFIAGFVMEVKRYIYPKMLQKTNMQIDGCVCLFTFFFALIKFLCHSLYDDITIRYIFDGSLTF